MKMVVEKLKMKTLVVSSLAFMGAANVCGTNYAWNMTQGGALDVAGNWNPQGVPQVGDALTLSKAQTAPYTLSGNALEAGSLTLYYNQTLDLGKGKSFLIAGDAGAAKIILRENATLTLLSGMFGIGDVGNRFFVGDYSNTHVYAKGADSVLRTSTNSFLIVGQGKPGNTLHVEDGAMLRGGLTIGVSSPDSVSNTVWIAGEGSRYVSTNGYYKGTDFEKASTIIGQSGFYNALIVSNKAEMVIGDARKVLMGVKYGNLPAGAHNFFTVTHGARAEIDNLWVGCYGSSNHVQVAEGGVLAVNDSFYVGRYAQTTGARTSGHTVAVTGENSLLCAKKGLSIGYNMAEHACVSVSDGGRIVAHDDIDVGTSDAPSNTLYVGAGGTLQLSDGMVNVGSESSADNVFAVAGGVFACTNTRESVDCYMKGAHGRMVFSDGACATVSNVFLRMNAPYTRFELSGGSFFSQAKFATEDKRYYINGPYAAFDVSDSTLEAPGLFISMGANANDVSNTVSFVQGAQVTLHRIVVGDNAADNRLVVDDAALALKGTLCFGYSQKTSKNLHASLRVSGAQAKITVENELMPRNDTAFTFAVPKEGFAHNPVLTCGKFEIENATSPSLTVTRHPGHLDAARIVLFKTKKANIDHEAFRARYTVNLPAGCSLDLSVADEIAVKLPSRRGSVISVR